VRAVGDLEERRDQALRDLAELDEQIDAGHVDEITAAELRRRYELEAAAAIRLLDTRSPSGDEPLASPRTAGAPTGSRVRLAVVSLAAVAAVATAIVLIPGSTGVRPDGGFVTGNEAVSGGRDLSEVTTDEMAAVVAENPDVVPMRLRLAHRYLDAGEDREALTHYLEVLEREDHPEAMSHLGWILFNDGRPDLASRLITESLEHAPDDAEAMWFLANVRLYGTADPEGAIDLLERLLHRDDLGGQRAAVEQALTEARTREDAP
jgi:tetratricopeptide (TPR) repeat protein